MELSVFSPILSYMSLDKALSYLTAQGVHCMELGCGGFPGTAHANAAELIADESKLNELKATFAKHNVKICALSTHGNAVHPNKEVAQKANEDFEATCILAQKLGVDTVITFSGCPGSDADSKYPNWVTCPWPDDFTDILDYQWNEVLIPYWKKATAFAQSVGIKKVALEMHPGFCVYNTETMLRLRKAVGNNVLGANVDPSHLIWQGMDVVAVIRALGAAGAIYHFHAKDTRIDKYNTAVNGVLDTKHYADELHRSWIFRSVGFGSDSLFWKDLMSELNKVGYNGAVSIEHEDSLMIPTEGLEKAIAFLKDIVIQNPKPSTINWA